MTIILEVDNLHVSYRANIGESCPALAGVRFGLGAGEILGVLGESGSGKSTLAAALLRVLPANAAIHQGRIQFEGEDLLAAPPDRLRAIRGRRIGLVFQEPSSSLHPTLRVGQQVVDVLAAHETLDAPSLREKSLQILASVFPSDVERISRSYPHELSGGQRQRVLIAQAVACSPALVVADEPTAALDPTTQHEILQLFGELRRKQGLSITLITHNPALLAGLADRILVLYAGRVAEIGSAAQVLFAPRHPYTAALLRCMPSAAGAPKSGRKTQLPIVPGEPPDLSVRRVGCQFEPRCADRMDVCTGSEPPVYSIQDSGDVACFKFAG